MEAENLSKKNDYTGAALNEEEDEREQVERECG